MAVKGFANGTNIYQRGATSGSGPDKIYANDCVNTAVIFAGKPFLLMIIRYFYSFDGSHITRVKNTLNKGNRGMPVFGITLLRGMHMLSSVKIINMKNKQVQLQLIIDQGFLPLYFHKETEVSITILKVLYKAGVRAVEYTNRGEAALTNFKAMKVVRDNELPGMDLGVGTIKSIGDAEKFLSAGADFLVSPGFVKEVAEKALANGFLYAPGCMTPTEIIEAEQNGIALIKLFPGNLLGPDFMSAIKEVFSGLKFMPTGGVDLEKENLAKWFRAGVCAVGIGSKMITKKIMEEKNYSELEAKTKLAFELIRQIRQS